MGFGISSIASSSLGDRKKGYPKRQALWELALALGRFSFDFMFFLRFFVFFKDFSGFCYDFDILGSDFDILGILGIWDTCAVSVFHLSLSFFFWRVLLSRVSFLFGAAQEKK